jgi:hypothetical protein
MNLHAPIPFSCIVYPLNQFSQEQDGEKILEICAEHAHVVPAEQYTTLADDQERFQAVFRREPAAPDGGKLERFRAIEPVFLGI